MHARRSLFTASLVCLLNITLGCDSDTQNCPETPYCDGNTRVTCVNETPKREECGLKICNNGECLNSGKCDANFIPKCEQGNAVYCENGTIAKKKCSANEVCLNGKCEGECDDNRDSYCKDKNIRIYCENSGWIQRLCPDDQICSNGECIQKPENCGNGFLDPNEICDDGVHNGFYGHCSADCKYIAECGNGILESSDENCDDGIDNGVYGKCRKDCSGIARCGDGTLDENYETCDEGELNGTYNHCSLDCKTMTTCGNGIVDEDEVCDDGKKNGQIGKCNEDCSRIITCGDGIIDNQTESCDPPSIGRIKTCSETCQIQETLFTEYPTIIDNNPSQTCTETDLWTKYFVYRERFVGNAAKHIPGFISWGTAPGESLPASHRDPNIHCSTDWSLNHDTVQCGFEELPDAQGLYTWGDTSLWLGIMVHWLTMEWLTFHELGRDTTDTEKYIYYAIQAFNRLDLAAEPFFGEEPALNGFFIRDDTHHDFYLKDGKYRFERTDNGFKGYACATSSNACQIYNNVSEKDLLDGGTFVSQDQITGLFEGFGAAGKLLPDDVVYENVNLKQASLEILHRSMTFMKSHDWSLGIQTQKGWLQIPEAWGGMAHLFSGMFAEAANFILGNEFGVEDYHDIISRGALELTKTGLSTLWQTWETINNYNRNLVLRILNFTNIWDNDKFNTTAINASRDIFAFSHAILHEKPVANDIPLWRIHAILASAPCSGPCNGPSCQEVVPSWMGEGFFLTPYDRFGSQYNQGEYNGLDYLIAHNVYFLSYAQKTNRPYTQLTTATSKEKGALQRIFDGEEIPKTYNIKDTNNISDMNKRFCHRLFADWLRDNALGLVDIYVNKTRFKCNLQGSCELSADNSPYTHANALILGTNQNDVLNIPTGFHHCVATLDGADNITIGAGYHIIESGEGNDTIQTNGPNVYVYAGDGDDTVKLGSGFHMVDAGSGNDKITAGSGTSLLYGGDGNDILDAGSENNRLLGGNGDDIIIAGNGDNAVWGNDGNDKIRLGHGNNRVWPGKGDAFVLLGNGNSSVNAVSPQEYDLRICFGNGKNTIWAGWSNTSFCSATQNSSTDNSCKPTLTAADCSIQNWESWNFQ